MLSERNNVVLCSLRSAKMKKIIILSITSFLLILCFNNIEARDREGVIFEVNKYREVIESPLGSNNWINDPAETTDTLNDRRCSEEIAGRDLGVDFLSMGKYLTDKMEEYDWEFRRHQNTAVDSEDFIETEDDDVWPTGFDSADVAYYLGHGSFRTSLSTDSHVDSAANPRNFVIFGMGEDDDWMPGGITDCRVNSQEMLLGNDTNIFISGACMHGRYAVFNNQFCDTGGVCDGFDGVRDGQLSVWNAWHSHGQPFVNEYNDYVNTSWSRGIGENWVDMSSAYNQTSANQFGEYCLISIVWGGNDPNYQWNVTSDNVAVRNAAWRFHRAGIGRNWTPAPGHNYTHSAYFYIAGCCPYDGSGITNYCNDNQLPHANKKAQKYYFQSHN